MELLRYQLAELSAAQIAGPGEDTELEVEEERLSKAAAHRAAAEAVYEDLSGDEQVLDLVGNAVARIAAPPAPRSLARAAEKRSGGARRSRKRGAGDG